MLFCRQLGQPAIHQASEVEFVDQGEGNYYLQAPDPFTRGGSFSVRAHG